MKQFRAYKALLPNKVSRKTTTGLKLGRLLDCSEAEIYNLANYVYSIPESPVGLVREGMRTEFLGGGGMSARGILES